MNLLRDIHLRALFCVLCGIVLMACCGQKVRAESEGNVESQIHLSQWLNMRLNSAQRPSLDRPPDDVSLRPYLPGLVWMVPEEVEEQNRMKLQFLKYLKTEDIAIGVSRKDAMKLASFVESLPVTGRVVVERTDPRWLEVNPLHDPVLQKGQRILIPSRPTSVTVVRGDGHTCQVSHSVHAFALDYALQCDPTQTPQIVWVVQPDGLVQRRGVAGWNENEQDPPAPGAWIVTDDPATPWPNMILEQLARLLATQGVASDKDISHIMEQPYHQQNAVTGQPDRLRNLELSLSDWGEIGLMQTPTARMKNAGDTGFSVSHVSPYMRMNVNIQPMDWIALTVRYTDISNQLMSPGYSQSYKDKSIDVRLKMSDESHLFPQTVVGLRDVGGTGLWSSEYVVANKRTGNLDWSLGLGWGYMAGRGNLGNPLALLNHSFTTRQTPTLAEGGTVTTSAWFTGPTALFGGVQYQTPWDPLILKFELDSNNYQHEPFNNIEKQTTPFNIGALYRLSSSFDLSMGLERGTMLTLGVSFHDNLGKHTTPKIMDPKPEIVRPIFPHKEPDWEKLAALLEKKTAWRVLQIRRAGSELIVRFDQAKAVYWNSYIDQIASILHKNVPSSVLVFRIQSSDYGLGMHEFVIDRQAWVNSKTGFIPAHRLQDSVSEQKENKGFVYPWSDSLLDRPYDQFNSKVGLTYMQTLGGPDGFVLYQIGLGAQGSWYFQPNTWWTGSIQRRLIDNYNNYTFTGSSNLPRVRTNLREYAVTSELTMPVFQFTHVGKLNSDQFYSFYGGMLESMFGGVGGEWLYRPWESSVAFGVDMNEVQKRGFAQDFAFQDYRILTGHASLYWDTGLQDINVILRAGRYLAGDVGATLDMSRSFKNGVKIGAYATKTNVSAAQFGEGSFDKGIYLNIPFDVFLMRSSSNVAHIQWQPLIRDGGAILSRQFPLIDLSGKQSGDLLKSESFQVNRKTQFGDVPDNFPDTPRDSVITAANKDMTELGHTATTPDFWWSMLKIGGISLVSAIADKPLDKLAVKYGNNGVMTKVETVGNNLPFIALGYSGLMYFASEQDTKVARASYSSLAAGGEGLMASLALKYTVGRARPSAEQGSTSFTPISKSNSNSSWPSIHATVMMAAITPYAKAYDASWLYGVAAVTNVARVAGRNHWFSDTVAGSLLGYAIGDFVWESHKTKKHGAEWAVSPNSVTAYWKIE